MKGLLTIYCKFTLWYTKVTGSMAYFKYTGIFYCLSIIVGLYTVLVTRKILLSPEWTSSRLMANAYLMFTVIFI